MLRTSGIINGHADVKTNLTEVPPLPPPTVLWVIAGRQMIKSINGLDGDRDSLAGSFTVETIFGTRLNGAL